MPSFNDKYWLFVADLKPAVAADSFFQRVLTRYNPGRKEGKPYVYVGYTANSHPTVKYPDGDFSRSRVRVLCRHGQGIRMEEFCTGNRTNKLRILRLVDRTIAKLRGRGWSVLNEPPNRDHHVYVFQLRAEAAETGKARKLNSDPEPYMPCVYVGQSALPPAERLEKHLQGQKGNAAVREYFQHMLPGLYEHLNPLTERESLEKEEAIARELRACGYMVIWS